MNTFWENSITVGIFTCLYLQLLLLGLFNLLNKHARNKILGIFCCIHILPFIYTLYWPTFNGNIYFNILLGGYKNIFIPVLLFLYLSTTYHKKLDRKLLVLHITIPILCHVSYLTTKFGFENFYNTNIESIVLALHIFILFSYLYYIFLGSPLLKKLKPILLNNIYKRYFFFFWGISICDIFRVTNYIHDIVLPNTEYLNSLNFPSQEFFQVLGIIANTGLLIFTILESPNLKSFILGDRIYNKFETIIPNENKIKNIIAEDFGQKKLFTNSNFDLRTHLKNKKISQDKFKLFLKKEYNQTPVEFINVYRVNEFKSAILLGKNKKYSVMGVAEKAGFNSKATFYRQFKQIEGVTPKEYLEQVDQQNV